MPDYQVLNTVTDRFSLYQNARKGRQNGRKYALSAVKAMLESPETQEGLKLGELFGYYGHGRRAAYHSQYGSLDLPEVSVLQVDGKPVVLENVPACRTIAIGVDDDGVVTHTQEILDTPTGKVLNGMIKSHAGGWSWATAGADMPGVAIPKSYHGCDYVLHPNFVSLDHPASLMMESADTRNQAILEGLLQSGFSTESSQEILQHYERMCGATSMLESVMRVQELELAQLESVGYQMALSSELRETKAMLESVRGEVSSLRNAEQARQSQLDELLDDLPIFVSHKQRDAIMEMNNPGQADVLKALFESVAKTNLALSPVVRKQVIEQIKAEEASKPKAEDHQLADISFTPTFVEFR
jgi:hypothetical protein